MGKKLVFVIIGILVMVLLSLIIYFVVILAGEFVVNDENLVMKKTSVLVDEDGTVLARLFIENREPVTLHTIPNHVQEAFISIEDSRFREHHGIDFRSIGRALYRDMIAGEKLEGGSTITQQLAKRVFLTSEKTFLRKTKEVLIAMNIERRYSKNQILEMYLNQIYFGHGAYGIQAASKLYFNKDVSELSIEEGALLAGLPKAPNTYSPLVNPERSKQRRDLILNVMQRQGYISAEESTRLKGKTVAVDPVPLVENEAYLTYIDMVLDEAAERYHLTNEEVLTGGYKIVVPMNLHMQEVSFSKMREDQFFPKGNEDAEAAFVLLDAKTGGVLAVQGGREYVRRGLNRVNTKRQPGSAFKPLAVYGPALEQGTYQPYSLLKDELLDYKGYAPKNYNHEYKGTITMYEAVTNSVNAPAVWLLNEIGIDTSHDMLEKFGLVVPDRGLATALGGLSEGVTPLDLAAAYRVFASGGKRAEPYFIKEIYRGNEKIGETKTKEEVVLSAQTAWYMTRMLESVVKEGTGKRGTVHTPLAGKTGTTSYPDVEGATMDAWFVGYTPTVVGAVWMGYDVTSTEHFLHGGSSYPTVLFKDIVNELPADMREVAFERPEDVQELEPPVDLPIISNLTATLAIGGRGLMSVELKWSAPKDDRVYYNIYERMDGERKQIATVVGDHHYDVGNVNPFSLKQYEIAPYDSVTNTEGEFSNTVDVEFKSLFKKGWFSPFGIDPS
ncbi:PBP1A family penicillin-binding protein [bacterium LRH843]|nr:PBP1A family penicillin-binding protein [bacterium LRH843]